MSWKDIVKGVEEYSFYFGQIEKVENLCYRGSTKNQRNGFIQVKVKIK